MHIYANLTYFHLSKLMKMKKVPQDSNTHRNSKMTLNEVYFWTDTIKDWKPILKHDAYKEIILSSWKELVRRKKIVVYAFVIMPNHLHVVWELSEFNGKEMPHASFNKFTSHVIIQDLKRNYPKILPYLQVNEMDRKHRLWQRDPLAIRMDNRLKIEQKINYIHHNPLQPKWNLVTSPTLYQWSSADFYENGGQNHGILTHYLERF